MGRRASASCSSADDEQDGPALVHCPPRCTCAGWLLQPSLPSDAASAARPTVAPPALPASPSRHRGQPHTHTYETATRANVDPRLPPRPVQGAHAGRHLGLRPELEQGRRRPRPADAAPRPRAGRGAVAPPRRQEGPLGRGRRGGPSVSPLSFLPCATLGAELCSPGASRPPCLPSSNLPLPGSTARACLSLGRCPSLSGLLNRALLRARSILLLC